MPGAAYPAWSGTGASREVQGADRLAVASASDVLGWAAGFLFAARVSFVFVSARWLNAGTTPGVVAAFALEFLLLSLALVQAVGPGAASIRWMVKVTTFRLVAAYLAFAGCSLFWTGAASPANSALYWTALSADVALILMVARGAQSLSPFYSILKGFVCASCLLSIVAWLLPPEQDMRLGDLDYFNTNQIGNLCALSLFLCSMLAIRNQGRWRAASVLLLLTLVRSLSKSTLIAFAVSQCYRLIADRSMTRKTKILFALCAVLAALVFWGLIETYAADYSAAGNQAETLTGRTGIWIWTLDAALNKPWIGNGIDAMWKVAPPFGGELFEARHAENELLQQFFAYGFAGVVLVASIYVSLGRSFKRIRRPDERALLHSLLVFILIRGLAEAEPFDLLLPLWLIVTLLFLMEGAAGVHCAASLAAGARLDAPEVSR